MRVSLLFTTYNSPAWLEKVFWSVIEQELQGFEVIVADDGSTAETRHMVEQYRPELEGRGLTLKHVWQRDEGFRKCRILNKALLQAQHDYVVFTDGDCVLRRDFLAAHVRAAAPGRYLSGTYFKLPMETSRAITRDDIVSQRCFDRAWLAAHGLNGRRGRLKLTRSPALARFLNLTTMTACNLKGSNASAWRADLLAVGGMDERLASGGQDRELGVRLQNHGIRARHVRFDAICLHLDHARGYRTPKMVREIREHRRRVEREGIAHTAFGTERLTQEEHGPPPLEGGASQVEWGPRSRS
jgi:glycosyltransferase involved in cell wall biosynthesis